MFEQCWWCNVVSRRIFYALISHIVSSWNVNPFKVSTHSLTFTSVSFFLQRAIIRNLRHYRWDSAIIRHSHVCRKWNEAQVNRLMVKVSFFLSKFSWWRRRLSRDCLWMMGRIFDGYSEVCSNRTHHNDFCSWNLMQTWISWEAQIWNFELHYRNFSVRFT